MKKLTDIELDSLIVILKKNGLDSTWLNYGGFSTKINPSSYNPNYREEVLPFAEMYSVSIGPDIYQISGREHQVYIDEIQNKKFQSFIDKEVKSKRFKEDFNYRFNAFQYEITMYSDAFIKLLGSREWWMSRPAGDNLLPLNAEGTDRDKLALEEAQKSAEEWVTYLKGRDIETNGFSISRKYTEVNLRPEEWEDLRKLPVLFGFKDSEHIPLHQIKRVELKHTKKYPEKFKEIIFETTGRKVILEIHRYGTLIHHIDPVII